MNTDVGVGIGISKYRISVRYFGSLYRPKTNVYITAQAAPVSEMTYTVSSGTLNSSIPYHHAIYYHDRRREQTRPSADYHSLPYHRISTTDYSTRHSMHYIMQSLGGADCRYTTASSSVKLCEDLLANGVPLGTCLSFTVPSNVRPVQARSYVQARGGSCLLVPRRLCKFWSWLAFTF